MQWSDPQGRATVQFDRSEPGAAVGVSRPRREGPTSTARNVRRRVALRESKAHATTGSARRDRRFSSIGRATPVQGVGRRFKSVNQTKRKDAASVARKCLNPPRATEWRQPTARKAQAVDGKSHGEVRASSRPARSTVDGTSSCATRSGRSDPVNKRRHADQPGCRVDKPRTDWVAPVR